MKAITDLIKNKWFLGLLVAAILSVLIVVFGPVVAYGDFRPLAGWPVRIALVWILFTVCGLAVALSISKSQRAEVQSGKEAGAVLLEEELGALSRKFTGAISILREKARKKGLARQYPYESPWYVMIGPPGAGKTTALIHSGLRFIPEEPDGRQGPGVRQVGIQGAGQTKNCDWWITEEAILVDTAGRYTTWDGNLEATRAGWFGLLGMLEKHRPLRPINGIILAMAIPDVLTDDRWESLARAMRMRVRELYGTLGLRFPVYLVFTKCDRVSGFGEYYERLHPGERSRTWGFSLSGGDGRAPREEFTREYRLLLRGLEARMLDRLSQEEDTGRCGKIFDFPQQMSSIGEKLAGFVDGVFHDGGGEDALRLRGIYFTSSVQEGYSMDCLVNPSLKVSRRTEEIRGASSGKGTGFFLGQLFRDVIFREAGLVGTVPVRERRRRFWHWGAYAGAALLIGCAAALWFHSYMLARDQAEHVGQQIARSHSAIEQYRDVGEQNFISVPEILTPLREAAGAYKSSPWYMAPRKNKELELSRAAENAYRRALNLYLLPLLLRTLEERIDSFTGDRKSLDDTLQVYLSLGDVGDENGYKDFLPKPSDRSRTYIRDWFYNEWQRRGYFYDAVRVPLELHLDALLDDRLHAFPLDSQRVQYARSRYEYQESSGK
uniref:Type VI secretion protein IcmF n=1 Tax=Candidatus Kentrum sp. DK TaxID=2126562 RepID=A0A450TDU1_9GAMM|nr:MAG: type VI secretion protein IcmF [Candidatus Kentron sp. DK]